MDYKTIKIEKPKWYMFKNIAAIREKTLQDIIDEALSLYLRDNKPKLEE
jgi:predicted DNA-binding ribbon-helix-helix protein